MERLFDTFREASREAANLCREHAMGASLERRGDRWAVVFDGQAPIETPPDQEPDPVSLEKDLLRAELDQIRRDFSSLKSESERLRADIALLEQEHILVKPLLIRDAPSPFSKAVLDKMPKENVETISRYEY